MAIDRYKWENAPDGLADLLQHELPFDLKHAFMYEAYNVALNSASFPTVGAVVVRGGKIVGRGHRHTFYSN